MTHKIHSFEEFDSEVIQLIQDLGLVLAGSPEHLYHLAICATSHYYRYHFCERYKDHLKEKERERNRLLASYYQKFRKGSRFKTQNELCVQDRLL